MGLLRKMRAGAVEFNCVAATAQVSSPPAENAIICGLESSGIAMSRPKPVLLLILDGWGHRDDPHDNAIAQARLPNWDRLLADCPHTLVETHGHYVGLPG